MSNKLILRNVVNDDLPIFFEYGLDQEANYMPAFTAKDPTNQEAFTAHWHKILANETNIIRTIIFNEQVAGSVSSYEDEGKPEVTYWLGKDYWGKGIATWALKEFLAQKNQIRPIYAQVAKDNLGSRRVFEGVWKFGWCPSITLMKLFQRWKQVFDSTQLIHKFSRDAIRQQFGRRPNVISHPGRHRRRDWAPAARRPSSARRFGHFQALLQAVMRQHQMVVGQDQPQVLFQPWQLLAKSAGFAGQATALLAQGQVLPFHKAGIDHATGRQRFQTGRDRRQRAKHRLGTDGHDVPALPLLDHLGIQQPLWCHAAAVRIAPAIAIARWLIPLTIHFQQRAAVLSQLVT